MPSYLTRRSPVRVGKAPIEGQGPQVQEEIDVEVEVLVPKGHRTQGLDQRRHLPRCLDWILQIKDIKC